MKGKKGGRNGAGIRTARVSKRTLDAGLLTNLMLIVTWEGPLAYARGSDAGSFLPLHSSS
jgi:hypothetical protein